MSTARSLWEILVPCQWNDGKPVRTRHHKEWDKRVRAISEGLTILSPVKGQWVNQGALFEERVIPVRVCCTEQQISRIMDITAAHYKQIAVMSYKISDVVMIKRYDDAPKSDKRKKGRSPEPPHVREARFWKDKCGTYEDVFICEVKMLGTFSLCERSYPGIEVSWTTRMCNLTLEQALDIIDAGIAKSWDGLLTPRKK